jgi:hypothetical protein
LLDVLYIVYQSHWHRCEIVKNLGSELGWFFSTIVVPGDYKLAFKYAIAIKRHLLRCKNIGELLQGWFINPALLVIKR